MHHKKWHVLHLAGLRCHFAWSLLRQGSMFLFLFSHLVKLFSIKMFALSLLFWWAEHCHLSVDAARWSIFAAPTGIIMLTWQLGCCRQSSIHQDMKAASPGLHVVGCAGLHHRILWELWPTCGARPQQPSPAAGTPGAGPLPLHPALAPSLKIRSGHAYTCWFILDQTVKL